MASDMLEEHSKFVSEMDNKRKETKEYWEKETKASVGKAVIICILSFLSLSDDLSFCSSGTVGALK